MCTLRELTENRRDLSKRPGNACIFGQEGSGVRFCTKSMIADILANTSDMVIAISTTDYLDGVVEAFGGLTYTLSPIGRIDSSQNAEDHASFSLVNYRIPDYDSSEKAVVPYKICLQHLDFFLQFMKFHVQNDSKRIWLFFEDITVPLADIEAARILERLFAIGRKSGIICTGLDHYVQDAVKNPSGICILANSPYIFLLNQSGLNAHLLSNLLQLEHHFERELQALRPATGFVSNPETKRFELFELQIGPNEYHHM